MIEPRRGPGPYSLLDRELTKALDTRSVPEPWVLPGNTSANTDPILGSRTFWAPPIMILDGHSMVKRDD